MKKLLQGSIFAIVLLGLSTAAFPPLGAWAIDILNVPILNSPIVNGGVINGATITNASGVGVGTVTSVSAATATTGVTVSVTNPTTTPQVNVNVTPASLVGITATQLSGVLPIANGGTNAASFTAPTASGVQAIPFFDGTRLVTDTNPLDVGYSPTLNVLYGNVQGSINEYVPPSGVGGTSEIITLSPVVAPTQYTEAQEWTFDAKFTNTTAAVTINVSGLGAMNAYMGSVILPVGGLVAGQKYRMAVEGTGPYTARVTPYDAVSSNGDTINGALMISMNGTTQLTTTNIGAQGVLGGSGYIGRHDAGAAMLSGNRLGFQLFGGAVDAAHAQSYPVGMAGFAAENWSGTNQGGNLQVYTTPNGSTSVAGRRTVATFGQDGSLAVIAGVSATTGTFSNGVSVSGVMAASSVTSTTAIPIASGGTNQTSFTAPASGVNAIPYYDGTRLVTDAVPGDFGYNAASGIATFSNIQGVTVDSTTNKIVTAASLNGGTLPASITTLAATSILGVTTDTTTNAPVTRASTDTLSNKSWPVYSWSASNTASAVHVSSTQWDNNGQSASAVAITLPLAASSIGANFIYTVASGVATTFKIQPNAADKFYFDANAVAAAGSGVISANPQTSGDAISFMSMRIGSVWSWLVRTVRGTAWTLN